MMALMGQNDGYFHNQEHASDGLQSRQYSHVIISSMVIDGIDR